MIDTTPPPNKLAAQLEKALDRRQLSDTHLRQRLLVILNRSVEYGRANRVLGDDPDDTACDEYVRQVIAYYKKYHSLVTCLEKGDPDAWALVVKKIQGWANGFLKRQGIHGDLRQKSVKECVTNAALAYLSGVYHYDSDFDPWLCVLVQNVCRKYIKEQRHPNQIQEEEAVSLDKFDFSAETLADKEAGNSQKLDDLRLRLLNAIEGLSSEARKELIILHYFSGYSFKEIALKMNKSLNAVYKLHFDALNDLRGNLDEPD